MMKMGITRFHKPLEKAPAYTLMSDRQANRHRFLQRAKSATDSYDPRSGLAIFPLFYENVSFLATSRRPQDLHERLGYPVELIVSENLPPVLLDQRNLKTKVQARGEKT